MKILIAPDSFKGTLTALEVADIISRVIGNNAECECLPLSDGGEGFCDSVYRACGGEMKNVLCHDIYYNEIEATVLFLDKTAVIESAAASGLQAKKRVMLSSSYGTGELIKFASEQGYNDIILGLGGTGCSDGGLGALSALGVRFYDENQNVMQKPKSNDMNFVFGMSTRDCVKNINLTYACDVENTYFGKNGAAFVFAPQKGANKTQIEELDEGLKRLNAFFINDVSKLKGAGAAGGMCGGLYSVYGGKIESGFNIVSRLYDLDNKIKNADVVITGEGKTDSQTLMGKAPFRIAELCKKYGKKCVVVSGCFDGVTLGDEMLSLVDGKVTADEAVNNSREVLYKKVQKSLAIILK